ncbi:hypothetical protein D3C75_1137290 [compost metagenome]
MLIVERGLLHRSKRVDPIEALSVLAPESVWIDNRLLVHGLVGRLVSQSLGQNLGTNGILRSRSHLSYLGSNLVCLILTLIEDV